MVGFLLKPFLTGLKFPRKKAPVYLLVRYAIHESYIEQYPIDSFLDGLFIADKGRGPK